MGAGFRTDSLRLLNALNSEDRGLKVRFSLATIAFDRESAQMSQILSSQGKNAPSNPYPHYLVRLATSRKPFCARIPRTHKRVFLGLRGALQNRGAPESALGVLRKVLAKLLFLFFSFMDTSVGTLASTPQSNPILESTSRCILGSYFGFSHFRPVSQARKFPKLQTFTTSKGPQKSKAKALEPVFWLEKSHSRVKEESTSRFFVQQVFDSILTPFCPKKVLNASVARRGSDVTIPGHFLAVLGPKYPKLTVFCRNLV